MIKGEKLKGLIARKGIAPEKFAEELGVSVSSVFKYYNKDSFDSSLLEKFANYFGVPVGYFFDEEVANNSQQTQGDNNIVVGRDNNGNIERLHDCRKEVEHLKAIIEEKERLIQVLLDKK
ncbi:MAG: helix-turn-helix transcriptional regulator [Alistipes sp.]